MNPELSEPAMVRIPEGWFRMGSDRGQDNERPVHRVWIDAFDLAVCQVTNTDYARFLRATGHREPLHWGDPNFSRPEQPVVAPSWFDAAAYCDWLSRATGRRYRLPTEAEWERAARGGEEQKEFPWGDQPPEDLPNYNSRWRKGPEPVGAERNAFGLYDIGANVHEWCADWFSVDYYSVSPEANPQGPREGVRRTSRGGSWRHYRKVSRCAARSSIPPDFQYADYGFRVARDVSSEAPF
ncbi:MAG TPA: formylglycine-generating enzyme family protein [Candidatus Cybelea sp.]|nr:formylglycine-generating enzyme family protein [Candidatus Cybelea sp.]